MSQTDAFDAPKIGAEKIILAVVFVAVIAALFYVSSQRQTSLRSSASGFEGLRVWLSSEGIEAQSFTGGWPILQDEIGLLIVPLFDTQPGRKRSAPTTQEELVFQQDEYDIGWEALRDKTDTVPTLIVLPKWRSGMRLTQLGHPALLVSERRVKSLARALTGLPELNLNFGRSPFVEFPYRSGDGSNLGATLYAAQTFSAQGCKPVLGTAKQMVIGDCPVAGIGGARALVLSDPDLLNNHGLTLGDNAFIARDLVSERANGGRVIIDYSPGNWLTDGAQRSTRERSWSDLMRFFSPPFTYLWVGVAMTFALVLWRSGLRFGPALRTRAMTQASRARAVAARARLMLLSGKAGPLAQDYAKARLAHTAAQLFGPAHGRQLSSAEAFLGYTQRRHPGHAAPLTAALNVIEGLPRGAPSRQALAATHDLDTILERITHDTRGT